MGTEQRVPGGLVPCDETPRLQGLWGECQPLTPPALPPPRLARPGLLCPLSCGHLGLWLQWDLPVCQWSQLQPPQREVPLCCGLAGRPVPGALPGKSSLLVLLQPSRPRVARLSPKGPADPSARPQGGLGSPDPCNPHPRLDRSPKQGHRLGSPHSAVPLGWLPLPSPPPCAPRPP